MDETVGAVTVDFTQLDSNQIKQLMTACADHLTHMGFSVSITLSMRPTPSVFDTIPTQLEVGS